MTTISFQQVRDIEAVIFDGTNAVELDTFIGKNHSVSDFISNPSMAVIFLDGHNPTTEYNYEDRFFISVGQLLVKVDGVLIRQAFNQNTFDKYYR